jgi:hypothetical protein
VIALRHDPRALGKEELSYATCPQKFFSNL